MITIDSKKSVPIGVDDNCHDDMTGKRGGMMWDESFMVNSGITLSFSHV